MWVFNECQGGWAADLCVYPTFITLAVVHLTTQVGRGGGGDGDQGDVGCVLVSDKEAAELEELLALFKLGLGETEQFGAALQVCVCRTNLVRMCVWVCMLTHEVQAMKCTLRHECTHEVAACRGCTHSHMHTPPHSHLSFTLATLGQPYTQEEAAALEAANVYAMLGSTPLVDGVIADLRRTQSILDDLDESLKV